MPPPAQQIPANVQSAAVAGGGAGASAGAVGSPGKEQVEQAPQSSGSHEQLMKKVFVPPANGAFYNRTIKTEPAVSAPPPPPPVVGTQVTVRLCTTK